MCNSWEIKEICLPTTVGLSIGTTGQNVFDLQNYLRRYGYLKQYGYSRISSYPSNLSLIPVSTPGEFDEGTSKALIAYQKFYGLEQTGILDEQTINIMSLPRCGVPDMPYLPVDVQWAHLGFKWPRNDLRWTNIDMTFGGVDIPPGMTLEQVEAVIQQSLQTWSDASPLRFSKGGPAEIRFRFTTRQTGDDPHDGPGGDLGICYSVFDNGVPVAPSQIFFDKFDSWFINIPNNNAFDFVTTTTHEIGHALGLGHTGDQSAVMFAGLARGEQRRALNNDDIDGIRALYR
jgi:Matrixin/Putative peptidoglycan binding domain